MTVSLEYDPDSPSQGGISRLRRLASFGRYGAEVHASARRSSSSVSVHQHKNTTEEYSLLAASLSSFYGWVAKQTGNRVVLGESHSKREQKLHVTQRVSLLAYWPFFCISTLIPPLRVSTKSCSQCLTGKSNDFCICRPGLCQKQLQSPRRPLLSFQASTLTRLLAGQPSSNSPSSSCHQSLPCR